MPARLRSPGVLVVLIVLGGLLPGLPASARADILPSRPIVVGNGLATISGDVSATYACTQADDHFCNDDTGFFNYTDYHHSLLRMIRIDLSGSVRAGDHVTVLGELRAENVGGVRPYALYVRIRPWTTRNFDVQLGRIPPTFGAFARRTYANDNPLIGYPLAYQYLTSLRADALPASADELLKMRGRGWLANYTIGDPSASAGVPLVSAFRWDTGAQAHGGTDLVDLTGSVTVGTLSNPLFSDDNAGRQVAGRVALHPGGSLAGLIVGASAAHGPFVSTAAANAAGDPNSARLAQTAWGADVEYSREHYLVRAETILSRWTLPSVKSPAFADPLGALSTSVEGRYRLRPGLYAAARVDHLGFSDITGATLHDSWDAPVTRVEVGGGLSLQRNLLLKLSVQHDARDGGRVHHAMFGGAQLVYWF